MIINNFNKNNYINNPSFESSVKYVRIGKFCLNKIDKPITTQSTKKTNNLIKTILKRFTPKRIKELAQVNCFAADKIKKHFDNLYGENNYTLIAIGRSVASIAETMNILGSDVKIIPLSGLRKCLPKNIPDINVYKKYLESIGLSNDSLSKNKNRKFILLDYVYSGSTLDNTDEFLRKHIFENNHENLIKANVNCVLKKDFQENLHILFSLNRFKDFSPVGKLDISNLKDCFEQANPITAKEYKSQAAKYLRELFLFNVMECLKTENFTNLCKKELEAIDKHHLSQKALKARLDAAFKKDREFFENLISKTSGAKSQNIK